MIKKLFIKVGMVIAILLMMMPAYFLHNCREIEEWYFGVIIGFFYDFYIFNIISCSNHINNFKNDFQKQIKFNKNFITPNGEKMSDKQKYETLIAFVEDRIIDKDIF